MPKDRFRGGRTEYMMLRFVLVTGLELLGALLLLAGFIYEDRLVLFEERLLRRLRAAWRKTPARARTRRTGAPAAASQNRAA